MNGAREPQTKKKKPSSRGKAGGVGSGRPSPRRNRRLSWRTDFDKEAREKAQLLAALCSPDPRERSLAAGRILEKGSSLDEDTAKALLQSAKQGWDAKHRTQVSHGSWASAGALAMARGSQELVEALWKTGWRFDKASAREFVDLGGLFGARGIARAGGALRRDVLDSLARADELGLWAGLREALGLEEDRPRLNGWAASWPLASDAARVAGLAQRHGGAQRKRQAWDLAFAGCCLGAENFAPGELASLEGLLRKGEPEPGLKPWSERMRWLWIAGASQNAPERLASLTRAGQRAWLDWRALGGFAPGMKEGDELVEGWASPAAWAQLARHGAGGEEVKAALRAQGERLCLPPLGAAKGMALCSTDHPEGAQGLWAAKWWLRMAAMAAFEPPAEEFDQVGRASLAALALGSRLAGQEEYEAMLEWAGAIGKLEARWSGVQKAATLWEAARGERQKAAWESACLRHASQAPESSRPRVRL